MATSPKRRRAVVIGVLLVVAGVVAAIVLWVAGSTRRSNAIENFARAPVGCDTTLDFSEAGTYLLFVESSGRLEDVRGDCDASERYDLDAMPPSVDITMIDPDGNVIDLEEPPSISYSSGEYAGRAEFQVDIAEAADHVIRVETESGDRFAVAVGRDPDDGVALLRGLAVLLGLAGVVVGLVVALAVGRSDDPSSDGWSAAQPGTSPWGAPPPTQPLYRPPPPPPGVAPPGQWGGATRPPPAPTGTAGEPSPFAPPRAPAPGSDRRCCGGFRGG